MASVANYSVILIKLARTYWFQKRIHNVFLRGIHIVIVSMESCSHRIQRCIKAEKHRSRQDDEKCKIQLTPFTSHSCLLTFPHFGGFLEVVTGKAKCNTSSVDQKAFCLRKHHFPLPQHSHYTRNNVATHAGQTYKDVAELYRVLCSCDGKWIRAHQFPIHALRICMCVLLN